MSSRVSVFVATSLDGFIARPDGRLDWLEKANRLVPEGEDCGYRAFLNAEDVLVMGRHCFEIELGFNEWPYGDKPVLVLSSQPLTIPAELSHSVSTSMETPQALVSRLSSEGAERIYIEGGITIQRFLAAGLVDDLTITLIPVLLGQGIPLFGPLAADIQLKCVGAKDYDFGFVQLKYLVEK